MTYFCKNTPFLQCLRSILTEVIFSAANFSPLAEKSLTGTKKGPIYNKIRDQFAGKIGTFNRRTMTFVLFQEGTPSVECTKSKLIFTFDSFISRIFGK